MCCFSIIGSLSAMAKKICYYTFPGNVHMQREKISPYLFHFVFTRRTSISIMTSNSLTSKAAADKATKRSARKKIDHGLWDNTGYGLNHASFTDKDMSFSMNLLLHL